MICSVHKDKNSSCEIMPHWLGIWIIPVEPSPTETQNSPSPLLGQWGFRETEIWKIQSIVHWYSCNFNNMKIWILKNSPSNRKSSVKFSPWLHCWLSYIWI